MIFKGGCISWYLQVHVSNSLCASSVVMLLVFE